MPKIQNSIRIQVSEQVIKFKPGDAPASFDVTVMNQSDQFASFQIELEAHGAAPDTGSDWYNLSPEVSTKKPPGDRTQFRVAITDTPVPGFVGTMNLTVRVSSLELRQEERQILRLILEPGKGMVPLRVDLPARNFQVRPSDPVEIPVHLYNPAQLAADVTLQFSGIDPAWMPQGIEQYLRVNPGGRAEARFLCQIPPPAEAGSRTYPFTILVSQTNGPSSTAEGAIDIVPTGFIEFSCDPIHQQIPEKMGWLPNPFATSATYDLQFENQSNLTQQVTVEIQEDEDQPKCTLEVTPETADLNLGETADLELVVGKRRHWFGRAKKYTFTARAVVSDPRLDVRNDTQLLRLRIQPILPFWMQIVGGAGILWFLWWLSWLNPNNPFWGHKAGINSVQLNGNAERLVSASDDQSMIDWRVAGFFNPLINQNAGTIGKTGKSIRVVRYRPVNNDLVAAGLENGEVQLWPAIANSGNPLKRFSSQKDDRVLDLAFSRDARYLFSSHGSGLVFQWDVNSSLADPSTISTRQRKDPKQFDFAVYALANVSDRGDTLAVGGRNNRLVLWNWDTNKTRNLSYRSGTKDDYILSLASSDFHSDLLAVSDNQGNLTLMRCTAEDCETKDQWRGSDQGKSIHSVALSANGCYLASTGDDGKVMLWALNSEGKRSPDFPNGKFIASYGTKLRSVALGQIKDELIVATGGEKTEVRVEKVKTFNKSCQ